MDVATVWLEDASGRRWPLGLTCALGRSSTNDIVIDDGKVSRRHALVHKQDESEFWVIDLGSGNGTYLNGRRLTQPTRLANGDAVRLGEAMFTFHHVAGRPISEPARSRVSAQTIINIKSLDCWLLVADIKASTQLASQLPPTELAMTVGRWMGSCKEVIDGHGGAINKFLGDGFFAYWVGETTLDDQLIAAVKDLRALQNARGGPRFRMVLHYGNVAFGGGGSLGEDSLSGVDVVIAFRMEKIAGGLGCDLMVSEEAKQRLGSAFSFRDLGAHALSGVTGQGLRFYGVV